MLRDVGSRDSDFIETVRWIRNELLSIAGVSVEEGYEAVLLQGSGTFVVEGILSTAIPPDGRLLILENGVYGRRMMDIARIHGIPTKVLSCKDNQVCSVEALEAALDSDPSITSVAVVHCETTTGIMNPIQEIGRVVARYDKKYIVDSMSAFGAIPVDFRASHIDYLASSANKCIEWTPGFGFAISRRDSLLETGGWARALSLDLFAQWKGLEDNGQFRFTPPTHVILAFAQALKELDREGGVKGRGKRYQTNHRCLVSKMRELGFREHVPSRHQGPIITSFRYPEDSAFDFQRLYDRLKDQGFVIYPGSGDSTCFRIGTIGQITPEDVENLVAAIRFSLEEMGVAIPISRARSVTPVV